MVVGLPDTSVIGKDVTSTWSCSVAEIESVACIGLPIGSGVLGTDEGEGVGVWVAELAGVAVGSVPPVACAEGESVGLSDFSV